MKPEQIPLEFPEEKKKEPTNEKREVDPELAAIRKRFAASGESDMQIGDPELLSRAEEARKRKKKHGLPGKS